MKFSFRFLIGVFLLILNYPVGWIGALVSGTLAVKTNNSVYYTWGAGLYGFSWIMFGVGALLTGSQGIRYSRQWIRKVWISVVSALKR